MAKATMRTPPTVPRQDWDAAREQLLVMERALTRARDALAAERRPMPWLLVEKATSSIDPKEKRACSTCSTGCVS